MKKLTEEERKKRAKDSRRKYQLENKDKVREYNRNYRCNCRLENKGKVREINRKYLLENKDKDVIPIEPMTMTKGEIEALEVKIARLKAKPLEELIYKRA